MPKVGGALIDDDVNWDLCRQERYSAGVGMKSFLRCPRPEVRFARDTGRLWVTRVDNEDVPSQPFGWRDDLCPRHELGFGGT